MPPSFKPYHGFIGIAFEREGELKRERRQEQMQQHAERLKNARFGRGKRCAGAANLNEPPNKMEEHQRSHSGVTVEVIVVRKELRHGANTVQYLDLRRKDKMALD